MARPRKESCVATHGDNPPRGKNGHCKLCATEYKRRRRAAGIPNSGNLPAQRKRDKNRKRAAVAAFRDERGCQRCGAGEGLHLHHRDPATKVADVSTLCQNRATWVAIWAEVAKCDVLCAACHLAHHHPHLTRSSV